MGGSVRRRAPEPGRPLSMRVIVLTGVVMVVVGAATVAALFHFYGGGTDRDRAGLDVVRTAGTLGAVTGGAITLLLAARRQRSTEQTLEHQRLILEHQREVAVEQRITELYTRAVDQLGNNQAPVRLGGLYALERVAQTNPAHRQTIVDVICAYLRMPFALPEDKPPAEDAPAEAHARYEQRCQELQVRLTAQRILAAHLKPTAVDTFWPDIDLDLTGTHLHELDLSNCHMRHAQFTMATFSGDAWFYGATFSGDTWFSGARFSGGAWFYVATFSGRAQFYEARFSQMAAFAEATFSRDAVFDRATFSGGAWFSGATFSGTASFGEATFSEGVTLDGARARPAEDGIGHVWPATWSTREAGEGEEVDWLYLVREGE